ncbi:MAG: hypothetical protein CMH81_07200 [Nitrospiraceae bacterium]|nr:hypothetical protein [Nitrospiraceae bacterium]|tara:strand:- start:734 stop:1798 length:1065 start_codon:yes stop_codon:yes gene_type:complete
MNDLLHEAVLDGPDRSATVYSATISRPTPVVKTMRLGVLNNPLSGGNRNGLGAIYTIQKEFPQIPHREVNTPEDISAALSDFAERGINLVAINGGDGTIQAVLTSLFRKLPFQFHPLLSVLRAGTTSMIAGDVGLCGSRVSAMRKLCAWAKATHHSTPHSEIIRRPVLRIHTAHAQEPLFGMFFGTGGITQGIEFCRTRIHSLGLRGEIAAGLATAMLLASLLRKRSSYVTPTRISTSVNQSPTTQYECLIVIVSTLERLFAGLRPYWGREIAPLHYTVLRANPKYMCRTLPALLRGRKHPYGIPEHGYISHNVERVCLQLECPFTLDGELFGINGDSHQVVVESGGHASFIRI